MSLADIREQSSDDIRREAAATEKEIWTLRFQRGSEKAADPSKLRHLRRQLARLRTVVRERELGLERGVKK
jgi:large subunit ribosomal protein L29